MYRKRKHSFPAAIDCVIATWNDVAALLASIYASPDDAASPVPEFDYGFIVAHEEFLVKLVAVTNRPTAALVAQAVEALFDDIGQGKARSFGTMVQRSVSAARGGMRSFWH